MTEHNELFQADAEIGILSILLRNPAKIHELTNLKEFMFSSDAHRFLYKTLQELISQNLIPEINLVDSYLNSKADGLKAGGREYLTYLYKQPYSEENIKEFERQVVAAYKARTLVSLSQGVSSTILNGGREINIVIEDLRRNLDSLTQNGGGEQTLAFEDVLRASWDELKHRVENPGIRGVSTSLSSLDIMLSGFCPGDLVFVAGRPGMGKTAFMCNLMLGESRHGIPVLIFSLEMTKLNLVERMVSIESEIPSHNIRLGELNKDQLDKISETIRRIKGYPIYIDSNYNSDLSYIITTIRKYVNLHKVRVVYVDYIQLLAERNQNSTHELGQISRAFKLLANELGITIVVGSQINRLAELREDKRPVLSDLRQSGNLEEDADVVIGLYRDSVYKKGGKDANLLEAIILKQRNGPVGVIMLNFYDTYMKVVDRL